jgi:AcrR family transcriptional regulator
MEPGERKERILTAAISLAKEVGYHNLTRDEVAERAGVSFGLVTHYFGTMRGLRLSVMAEAIAQEIPEIVANGLATGDSLAKSAPPQLKEKAAALISA